MTALDALGIRDITVLTQRAVAAVASPIPTVRFVNFDRIAQDPRRVLALEHSGPPPLAAVLAEHDVIVNCVLQDTDAPIIFVMNEELGLFARGTLFVDVSSDEGMGFEWARPDDVRRSDVHRRRRRALLRRRPQPVAPLELGDVGDQRGAARRTCPVMAGPRTGTATRRSPARSRSATASCRTRAS